MNEKKLMLDGDIPNAITNTIEINEPNTKLVIYKGIYLLKNLDEEIQVDGEITFEWFVSIGVKFQGIVNKDASFITDYTIIIDGLEFGKAVITRQIFDTASRIKGNVYKQAIIGDKSIAIQKIKFLVINFIDLEGSTIKTENKSSTYISNNRLTFEDDSYSIIIDKYSDFKMRMEALNEKGGYLPLYNGEFVSKKGNMTHSNIQNEIHCLGTFLSFLNGRRTSPLFIQGIYEEDIIWTDYYTYNVDQYKRVGTWTPKYSAINLSELWKNFRLVWSNQEDKNFLITLIHWYIEANGQSGYIDGSIILAQTALELVYNWWIVESKKMILGKDSDSISASNKIRLILSQLNTSSEIPPNFSNLTTFKNSEKLTDAPETIVYIRNAIVHSNEDKRKKLSLITPQSKYEALQVYIWYIELSLLRILNYNKIYSNRSNIGAPMLHIEQQVPWVI